MPTKEQATKAAAAVAHSRQLSQQLKGATRKNIITQTLFQLKIKKNKKNK